MAIILMNPQLPKFQGATDFEVVFSSGILERIILSGFGMGSNNHRQVQISA